MFRETVVKGLRTRGEEGKGRDEEGKGREEEGKGRDDGDGGKDDGDWVGGSASNVRIEGGACSSTRLGNRLGELKGETSVGGGCCCWCWKLAERGDTGGDNVVNRLGDGGVPQIVLR